VRLRTVALALGILVAVLLSSCGSSLDGATPEQAVFNTTGLSHTITFHGRRSGPRSLGQIVLLSTASVDANGQAQPNNHMYWYRRTTLQWSGLWSAGDGGLCANDNTPVPPGRLVASNAHRHNNVAAYNNAEQDFSVVCGRSLSPTVSAVEVQFADGQVLRDQVTNQMFFIAVQGVVAACTVSVIGVNGTLLEHFAPTYIARDGRDGPPPDVSTCTALSQ